MTRFLVLTLLLLPVTANAQLHVGFGEADVTPKVGNDPVYIAGFGKNRLAKGVHDPIMARAIVLKSGDQKVAIVSVDLVGLFYPVVERVRKNLPGFTYVLVSCTHNHEGPDTLGLWGPTLVQSGIDRAYLQRVERTLVEVVMEADKKLAAVKAVRLGSAKAPELLHDNREPYIKHDDLVAVQFEGDGKTLGVLVQWNCHPETLDSKNVQLSADFVAGTVADLKKHFAAPVVYLTGTVGGLMTSLHVEVKDDAGKALADGTFEKTTRYGRLVADVTRRALKSGKAGKLTPIAVQRREIFLPLANPAYILGYRLGVLERPAYVWADDPLKAMPVGPKDGSARMCVKTEIARLRLGDLDIACIPGEIYPELVLGKVQDPPDAGADFPDAPIEPAIFAQLDAPYRMLVGLANDELGYIIPKRQWDDQPPYCYGRKKSQYGEINSLGADTAPILCRQFQLMCAKK